MINAKTSVYWNLNGSLYSFCLFNLFLWFINVVPIQYLAAQERGQENGDKKEIQLSPGQLKTFEGYFQNPQNEDMVVQFTMKENSLHAKLFWNDNQIDLYPDSPLEFFSKKGESIVVKFLKGSDGSINQFSIQDNNLWNRINNYKPKEKSEIAHTPIQLKIFEGLYQLQNEDRFIQIYEKDNNLILKQHWDGEEIAFVPDSELSFFSTRQKLFTIQFTKDNDGQITRMLAFRRDLWIKSKKIHLTQLQLKEFEGKYQFKDDKDDIIQIRAVGENLVFKQLWDGKETVLFAQTDSYFYNGPQAYPAKFNKNNEGVITSVVVLDGDIFERIKD